MAQKSKGQKDELRARAYEMADHSDLNAFGAFLIIDRFAQKYNYTHEEVTLLEDDLVFLILLKEQRESEFKSRYDDAMSLLNKQNTI